MEHNLAVLIDFENIAAGTEKENLGRFDVDAMLARVKDKGRILVSRAFGDWGRFARFKQGLLSAGVTMMELTSHGMQDKNRADIAMVVDCLELAFTRDYIDTFVIVSGDSDFTPLAIKMRELNKRVLGIGTRGSTSRLLINACDEFIFYDTIVSAKRRSAARVKKRGDMSPNRAKSLAIMTEVLDGMVRENPEAPLASVLKTAVLRRLPDFNESDIGFSSFARFLESARDAGYITLDKDKKSGGYRVFTVEESSDPEERGNSGRSSRGASRGGSASGGGGGNHALYDDPYYPEGALYLVEALHAAKMGPLGAPTRMALLEALVEAVAERKKKRRRTTIPFVVEDIRKRLRRTYPELSPRHVKDVLGILMNAGALVHHKDGSPIRSANAPFSLDKGVEPLNRLITENCLGFLRKSKADLDNVPRLAELFFGNKDRAREVEEILAWMVAPSSSDDALLIEDDALLVEDDALLVVDDDLLVEDDALLVEDEAPNADEVVEAPKAEKAPKKKPARSRSKKKAEPKADAADDALLVADDDLLVADEPEAPKVEAEAEPAPEKKPRRRTRTKKAAPAEAAAEPAEADEAKAEDEASKAKPKKRAPRRKKAPAKAAAPAEDAPKADDES